jgi:hypothetical protein
MGTILVAPVCLLVFLIGWPLYVLFDVPVAYVYDDDDAMTSALYHQQQQLGQTQQPSDLESTKESLKVEAHR